MDTSNAVHDTSMTTLEKNIRSGERWLIGIGIVTVLLNALIAWIYHGQLIEMRKATLATTDAVKVARDTLTETQNSNNRQNILSNRALNATEDEFKKDQRPYIGQTVNSTSTPEWVDSTITPGSGQFFWNWHMTNYGKSPANHISYTEEIKVGDRPWRLSQGAKGPSIGNPLVPGGGNVSSVVSPVITKDEFNRLLRITNGMSFRVRISYSGLDSSAYETGLCMSRTNMGSITYCASGNYIK